MIRSNADQTSEVESRRRSIYAGAVIPTLAPLEPSNTQMDHSALKSGSSGRQRGLHQVGGFVRSETVHLRGQDLPGHAHELATINFVLAGAYAERFRGSSDACGPATLIIKPAGEAHANNFRASGARCLLIELTPARTLQPLCTTVDSLSA